MTAERPDLVALLRRAFSDPGQYCTRERWEDTSGIAMWEYETIPAWGARAAAKALAGAGLLRPPGGTTHEERGFWNSVTEEVQTWWSYHNQGFKMPDRVRTVTTWPDGAVYTGPWLPLTEVSDDAKESR